MPHVQRQYPQASFRQSGFSSCLNRFRRQTSWEKSPDPKKTPQSTGFLFVDLFGRSCALFNPFFFWGKLFHGVSRNHEWRCATRSLLRRSPFSELKWAFSLICHLVFLTCLRSTKRLFIFFLKLSFLFFFFKSTSHIDTLPWIKARQSRGRFSNQVHNDNNNNKK